MCAASTSRTSMPVHDVFLSHRGKRMKNSFASCLHQALTSRGIKAFLDKKSLPQGEDVRKRVFEAAESAPFGVPIFTDIYGNSCWCLEELLRMMETCEKNDGEVIPIFFSVEPENLVEAFQSCLDDDDLAKKYFEVRKLQHDQSQRREKLKQWKGAVEAASYLAGFRRQDYSTHGDLIQAVVETILKERGKRISRNTPFDVAVPLDVKAREVEQKLCLEDQKTVHIVLLWGMVGVGKTTLARVIFHRFRKLFVLDSFVDDCGRLKASEIQDLLRQDLLEDKPSGRDHTSLGKETLRQGLQGKRVLIVLDDIKYDSVNVKDVVALESLCPGSRILITSRDLRVFPQETIKKNSEIISGYTYELQFMDRQESSRLFHSHVPSKLDYDDLTQEILDACDGLPLSLEVVGKEIQDQENRKRWGEALKKLRRIKYKTLKDKLEASCHDLDEDEQEMFKDVACFFIGEYQSSAKCLWESGDLDVESGLEKLVEMSLVKLRGGERLSMHSLLRDWGRVLGKGSKTRLCNDEELQELSCDELDKMRGLQVSLHCLDAGALATMRSLQVLFVNGSLIRESIEGLKDRRIRWLKSSDLASEEASRPLPLRFLTVLRIFHQQVKEVPCSLRLLKRLRVLDITGCHFLEALPEGFGDLESLEVLQASELKSLTMLPSSVGQLKRLRVVNISHCCRLQVLPQSFGDLERLEELQASHLSSLTELPSTFGRLKKLRLLDISKCIQLTTLPESFSSLESLEELRASFLSSLTELPSTFTPLKRLRLLDMSNCGRLTTLPEGFGFPESLKEWHGLEFLPSFDMHIDYSIPSSLPPPAMGKAGLMKDSFCLPFPQHDV